MADNIDDDLKIEATNWLLNVGSPTRPPGFKLRLMAVNGSATANGTEITPGGGYTAGGATLVWDTAADIGGVISAPNQAVSWTNMPAATVVGVEAWDTSGSPRRVLWAPLVASRTVVVGDTFLFEAGKLRFQLD
jgi:hypothetical protein